MKVIKSNHYGNAWAHAIQYLMENGREIPAAHDRNVMTKDDMVVFELTDKAINDMLGSQLHPQASMVDGLQSYVYQFIEGTTESITAMREQPYTYFGRTIDQVRKIQELGLMEESFNRRITIKTWNPKEDLGAPNPPCLQEITLKRLENNKVEVYTHWRSHDLYGAWLWNNIAICKYIHRELIKPYDLKIDKFVETNISLHVYDYDWAKARMVHTIPVAITRRV